MATWWRELEVGGEQSGLAVWRSGFRVRLLSHSFRGWVLGSSSEIPLTWLFLLSKGVLHPYMPVLCKYDFSSMQYNKYHELLSAFMSGSVIMPRFYSVSSGCKHVWWPVNVVLSITNYFIYYFKIIWSYFWDSQDLMVDFYFV